MSLEIRKAKIADIRAIVELVNGYAAKGVMLPRTEFELAENVRDFTVIYDGNRLVGCGALHIYTPSSAEVRSLAVYPDGSGRGIGRRIVEALDQEAADFGLSSIFAFTYVPGFFAKLGYVEVDRDELPLKAWKDCLKCPKFQACDEIAVMKRLPSGEEKEMNTRISGDVVLPVLTRSSRR